MNHAPHLAPQSFVSVASLACFMLLAIPGIASPTGANIGGSAAPGALLDDDNAQGDPADAKPVEVDSPRAAPPQAAVKPFRRERSHLLGKRRERVPVAFELDKRAARNGGVQLFDRMTLAALEQSGAAGDDDGLVPDLELDDETIEKIMPDQGAPEEIDIANLPRARGLQRESRVFWYTMGASAIASLLVRVVAVIPVVIAIGGTSALTVLLGPAATLALFVALGVSLMTVDAAVAALAATVTFDSMSEFFSSRYLSSFSGHFLGNALAVGVVGLIAGFAIMLVAGVTALADFAGPDLAVAFSFISAFGALPGFPLAFFAGFALPAILGAWATAASADAADGFVIDSGWFPLEGNLGPKNKDPTRGGQRRAAVFNTRVLVPGS